MAKAKGKGGTGAAPPDAVPGSARGAALALVLAVTEERRRLAELTGPDWAPGLSAPERARAQRLASSALRHLSRADAVLKPLLRRNPPPAIRAILRLATVEMLAEGGAPHGVVGAAVDLARAADRRAAGLSGMVNAVLRRVAEAGAPGWQAAPVQALPGWLRGRLMAAYGKAAVQAMEAAHEAGAALDLTPRDGDAGALAARLEAPPPETAVEGPGQKPRPAPVATILPTGSLRLAAGGSQVSALPGFSEGEFWVQDAAAALAAMAMHAQPGEKVLDLCAAPGGKTLQLAAAGAEVTALDISGPRMERLAENLARCRLTATLVVADALHWQAPGQYDAVLLDAPCSASGTIRRHPDLAHVLESAALAGLRELQTRLFDRAVALVKPGGRLVVASCSLLPEEGEELAASGLARHADLRPDPAALALTGIAPEWRRAEGGLRLRPDYWADRGGMDGFFIAAFTKTGEPPGSAG